MQSGMNLIYNGDFSFGTDSWTGTRSLSVEGGVATVEGDFRQNIFIPIASDRRYRLTFDIKINVKAASNAFYIALWPYDNNRNTVIPVASTNKPWAGTDTTLAAELKNGDTTATLTSGSGWTIDSHSQLGICTSLAWGYKRAVLTRFINVVSDNVVTFRDAWNGGTFAAGTKVAEFRSGNTYFYPWYSNNANLPMEWTTISVEFDGSAVRYSCQYITFNTLGYTHNYSMKNIRLECISDPQFANYIKKNVITVDRRGIFTASSFNEEGMPIRYIRDTTNGSTANTGNHICELKVFNNVGENIAWGKTLKRTNDGVTYANSVMTDGIVNSSYVSYGSGSRTMMLDIGYEEYITKIIIWHYYPDKRTYYDNVVEVSTDGENWYKVYEGEKPETADGNIITLPNRMYMNVYGDLYSPEFIEV